MGQGKRRRTQREIEQRARRRSAQDRVDELLDRVLTEAGRSYPAVQHQAVRSALEKALALRREGVALAQILVQALVETHADAFLPVGLLAGLTEPGGGMSSASALFEEVTRLLSKLRKGVPPDILESSSVADLRTVYAQATLGSSKGHVRAQDDGLLKHIRSSATVSSYTPRLLFPPSMTTPGPVADRELLLKAAEEILLLSRFAALMDALQALESMSIQDKLEPQEVTSFAENLSNMITSMQELGTTAHEILLNRYRRLSTSYQDRKRTEGKTETKLVLYDLLSAMGLHEVRADKLRTHRFLNDIYAIISLVEDPGLLQKPRPEQIRRRNGARGTIRKNLRKSR